MEIKQKLAVIRHHIRQARSAKGYSQSFMGSMTGTSQTIYRKIENGDLPLTVEQLIQILDVLEMDIKDILAGTA